MLKPFGEHFKIRFETKAKKKFADNAGEKSGKIKGIGIRYFRKILNEN
ncbi:hypothetical protein HNQ03_000291 [Chryseobacterium sp. 16F]|uniref:Uncharacterized protein n=1 Tax=Frigoriflavimonas asaccharolytica TaxID=2735899 RepID=A0A8J8G8G5_9FLAO|nr:hypothetical protein [Frigoriflavimonas asaccharolytica]